MRIDLSQIALEVRDRKSITRKLQDSITNACWRDLPSAEVVNETKFSNKFGGFCFTFIFLAKEGDEL